MICLLSTRISRKSLVLGLILAAGTIHPSAVRAQEGNLDAIASREIARRQEDLLDATQLVAKGDKAMAEKDFETAYVSYLDALDKTPAGPATAAQHAIVLEKFSQAGIAYAQLLISNGRYADAEKVAKTILLPQYNPTFRPAVQLLSNLEQPGYYNKTITPAFANEREQVTKLLFEAQGFYQSGRYDLAEKRYEQVLNIDPYNIAARKGMEQAVLQKDNYQHAAYNETRSQMLWLVDRSWERPVKKFQLGRSTEDDPLHNHTDIRGTDAITAKLNRIIIPHIDLRDTTVQEAVEYLKQQSKQLDTTTTNPKERKGVNIVLKLDDGPQPVVPAASPGAAGAAPATASAPVVDAANERITLALSNVPLIEALRYLTELAGLKYKIEPYAVSIVPLSENTQELVTKEYRVPPSFIPTNAAPTPADNTAAPTAGAATSGLSGLPAEASRIGTKVNAMEYLQSQGVAFPDGSFAQYVPAGSKLIVRNTPDAIDLIDNLVDAAVGVQPTQVEIESKFLEVTQNNLSELGFDWLLGPFAIGGGTYGSGGTRGAGQPLDTDYYANYPFNNVGTFPVTSGDRSGIGTSVNSAITANGLDSLLAGVPQGTNAVTPGIFGLSGIFSNVQFQMVIRALNQKKGIDLMSAPKVTTKSGSKAVVKVVREFPYPTEFNPPQPPPAAASSSSGVVVFPAGSLVSGGVVTPTTPTAFQKRDLGVTLEAEPVVGPDGYTIDLNLSPEVVEFDGFINYGSPIFTYQSTLLPPFIEQEIATPNVINQPVFSVRKVTTSVSIWDGQTVSLGGLIREDVQKVQDKVPLLGDIPIAGRLFRNNVDQKIKRNLIIFVTARLLDAEGKPVRQDEDQEEIVEPLGVPELPAPTFQTATFGK